MARRPAPRDRGQIIIVTALVIAAIFVGLALVLNSGIYAENLSSRETTETTDALGFTEEASVAVAEAYQRTNANGSATAAEANETFTGMVDGWLATERRRGAARGVAIDVDHTPHVGWRLEQSSDGAFTNTTGDGNWTVAEGASDVGEFEMEVQQDQLHDAHNNWGSVNSSFNVRVDDGTDEWRLYVFKNSSGVVVHAGVPGTYSDDTYLPGDETCVRSASRVLVDFRNESLDGTACDAMNFSDDLDGAVDISYRNATNGGEKVNGTYTLVVNGSNAVDTSEFNDPDGADPTATAVIYAADYTTFYARSDVSHDRSGRHLDREETYAS